MRMEDENTPRPAPKPAGPGWSPLVIDSPYAMALGALWAAPDPARLWVQPDERLSNIAGVVHGGALATLADVALFVIAGHGTLRTDAVTLTLDLAYVAPARLGTALVASGEIVREGRSIVFVGGRIEADGACVLTFSGTLKTVRR